MPSPLLPSEQPPLEVYLLGLVDFIETQKLQRRLVYDLGELPGAALILCEHPTTISVGRSGSRSQILPDDKELLAMGVPVHWVNRGGGCVLHLPGQISAYLTLSLNRFGFDLQGYLNRLNQTVIAVLKEFELEGNLRSDLAGVFLGRARVASCGLAVNRWIAYHGFTLNVGPFLEPFEMFIEEPGIGMIPLRQTSMESRRQRITPMPKVRESLIRNIELHFGLERHHLYTQHPLIRRKGFGHAYVPSPR